MASKSSRNVAVEQAVSKALEAVDEVLDGLKAPLPSAALRRAIDGQIERKASVRVASFFLMAYVTCDPMWDVDSVPVGIRGVHGDKRLAGGLSERDITLHDNITAFGENLGWKGNVGQVRLSTDSRFEEFAVSVKAATSEQREVGLTYFAGRFAESRRLRAPMPTVPDNCLTFARARVLFYNLIGIQSEGHIQQFVVAGLLRAHRRRFGFMIKTHHPHASDTFDRTSGDIEEFRDGILTAAYEVTDRPDWKNRLQDFRQKMHTYGLKKYWIIASGVSEDPSLADPNPMLDFLASAEADLAIVDIDSFVDVFIAELHAEELVSVINEIYADLINPNLSNRQSFIDAYLEVVGEWLDLQEET